MLRDLLIHPEGSHPHIIFARGLRSSTIYCFERTKNSPILFACIVLVALSVLYSRQEQRFSAQSSLPSDWLRASQGVGSVASITRVWIQHSRSESLLLGKEKSFPCRAMKPNFLFAELLSDLDLISIDLNEAAAYEPCSGLPRLVIWILYAEKN